MSYNEEIAEKRMLARLVEIKCAKNKAHSELSRIESLSDRELMEAIYAKLILLEQKLS